MMKNRAVEFAAVTFGGFAGLPVASCEMPHKGGCHIETRHIGIGSKSLSGCNKNRNSEHFFKKLHIILWLGDFRNPAI